MLLAELGAEMLDAVFKEIHETQTQFEKSNRLI
jgi:hypothetical protein